MTRTKLALMNVIMFLFACDDSASKCTADEEIYSSSAKEKIYNETTLPECEKNLQSSLDGGEVLSLNNSFDTVCFYKEFPIEDTICCFGEPGTYLQRDENGNFISVSSDYGIGKKYDTLSAAIDPSEISRCLATIGNEHYRALKIGSQIWLSENVRGNGRCLNDNTENCKLFGSLMSYNDAKKACSADFRLPTSFDIDVLLHSVGATIESTYKRDVCGETPDMVRYYNVPLFAIPQDSSKKNDSYEFAFRIDGGIYDKNYDGKEQAYSVEKACFFLLSDEKSDFRKAFCYDVNGEYSIESYFEKDAELYARCIMK